MEDCWNILIIDDDEVDRMNIQHLLDGEGVKAVVHEASTCSAGMEKLTSQSFDCVLIDYRLPDATGLEVMEQIVAVDDIVPMILLTGMGGEQLVAEVMKKGATDYLSKNQLNGAMLVHSIRGAVRVRNLKRKACDAENALAESEKTYRTIVETVSDIIFRLGPDRKIEFVNPAIRFFGYEPADMVGRSISEFFCVGDGDDEVIAKIATQAVGPLATRNLEVSLKVGLEPILDEEVKPIPVLLDAFGLWDVSDEHVFKNDVEKKFLGTLCIARNIMELKAVEEELLQTQHRLMNAVTELKELSTLDGLTEIANRRFFDEYSEKEWKRAQREKHSFSVVMIDLDCFKAYNDAYGHQQGDVCLKKVAEVIKNSMKRPADFAARYGGEEFVLILPETNEEGAGELAEKLRNDVMNLNLEHPDNSCENRVTISLGIASDTADPEKQFSDLLAQADKALYRAKNKGRNQTST
ncbi:MAG: diguanylate cyclase [Nitrospinaceae bacterium]|nr:diguanylate cyclase [Nitrospinaceae bacterium]